MVLSAETCALEISHESRPKPCSHTRAPLRPMTTAAPGNPPAFMPRAITLLMASRRRSDMPTALGLFTGNPDDAIAAATTRSSIGFYVWRQAQLAYGMLDEPV